MLLRSKTWLLILLAIGILGVGYIVTFVLAPSVLTNYLEELEYSQYVKLSENSSPTISIDNFQVLFPGVVTVGYTWTYTSTHNQVWKCPVRRYLLWYGGLTPLGSPSIGFCKVPF